MRQRYSNRCSFIHAEISAPIPRRCQRIFMQHEHFSGCLCCFQRWLHSQGARLRRSGIACIKYPSRSCPGCPVYAPMPRVITRQLSSPSLHQPGFACWNGIIVIGYSTTDAPDAARARARFAKNMTQRRLRDLQMHSAMKSFASSPRWMDHDRPGV